MTRAVNLGLIGCGDIGMAQHLPAIARCRHVRLVAVCDADERRATMAAQRFGAQYHTQDYHDLLDDEAIEAVVIATPPWISPHLTVEALHSGKDVLCEKPMATSIEAAREVAEAEQETGRLVQIGFTYRHGPLMDTLRGWIASGRLGRPLLLRMGVFDETWDPDGNPEHYERIMRTLRHGPPCVHDGAHSADHLHFLTGSEAVRVLAWGLTSRPEFPAPNYNVALIEFANGDRATLEIGWFYPHLPGGEFEVIGPLGSASFDRTAREVVLRVGSITERVQLDDDWFASCFSIQLDKFIAAIHSRSTPVPGTAEGMASLRLCKMIEAAMASEQGS